MGTDITCDIKLTSVGSRMKQVSCPQSWYKFCPFFSPGSGISKFLAGMLMESGPGLWVNNKLHSLTSSVIYIYYWTVMHRNMESLCFILIML